MAEHEGDSSSPEGRSLIKVVTKALDDSRSKLATWSSAKAKTSDSAATVPVIERASSVPSLLSDDLALGFRRIDSAPIPDPEPAKTDSIAIIPNTTSERPNNDDTAQANEAEAKSPEEQMFLLGNIDGLLEDHDNPTAQMYAATLLSNRYRRFNFRNPNSQSQLMQLNLGLVVEKLGMDDEAWEELEHARSDIDRKYRVYRKLDDAIDAASRVYFVDDDQKQAQTEYIQQSGAVENGLSQSTAEFFLPLIKGIVHHPGTSEAQKREIIEGLKNSIPGEAEYRDDRVIQGEDTLLQEIYANPQSSEDLKDLTQNVALGRIRIDIHALDVIPLEDLSSDQQEKAFLAAMGNLETNAELVTNKLAPLFLPDLDPQAVTQAWDVLRKVTWSTIYDPTRNQADTERFGNNDSRTDLMNRDYFREFVENSETILPLVDMLSKYGFRYSPFKWGEDGFVYSPEYIEGLKKLAVDQDVLEAELAIVRQKYPNFHYDYRTETVYDPLHPGTRYDDVKNNPYAMVYEQTSRTDDESLVPTLLKDAQKLLETVPDRWQDTYIRTVTEHVLTRFGNGRDLDPFIRRTIVAEVNQLLNSPGVTDATRSIVGTNFVKVALHPDSKNVAAAYAFLQKNANKVFLLSDGERPADRDLDPNYNWYCFTLKAGDLYRYPLFGGQQDEQALASSIKDFDLAYRALNEIQDPKLRDQAAANMVVAYTDLDYRDLARAREIAETITDPHVKERAEQDILLEIEREQRGESNAWKKLEKVNRVSSENLAFLQDVLGFSDKDPFDKDVYQKYEEITGSYLNNARSIIPSPEVKARLEEEVSRIKDQVSVTVNITWDRVKQSLDAGRLISIWENEEEREKRNNAKTVGLGGYHYATRRDQVERKMDNRAKGGARDPHPIYGAMASPNGRDEFLGGVGGGYGECFVSLKSDRVKGRTTFTYDDSFDGFVNFPLSWDDAITAKAMLNLVNHQSRHGYVEGQLLGGVTVDDIDTVYIPKAAIGRENAMGWQIASSEQSVMAEIEQLRTKFPNVKFELVEEPEEEMAAA